LIRSDFHACSLVPSSIHRIAGCGPACPVVWQGRTGDRPPYADCAEHDLSCLQPDGIETLAKRKDAVARGLNETRSTATLPRELRKTGTWGYRTVI
jgi:hypothetical protein